MKPYIIAAISLISFASSALAADFNCSIKPPKNTSDSELPNLAKISKSDAQKKALAAIKSQSTTVSDSELESEKGCLVYSFDIKIDNKSGVEEVIVDAGTGEILSNKHENALKEVVEKATDKVTKKK